MGRICERDKVFVRDVKDISIHEYSWGPKARLRGTHQLLHPIGLMVTRRLQVFLSVEGDVPIGFRGGMVYWKHRRLDGGTLPLS